MCREEFTKLDSDKSGFISKGEVDESHDDDDDDHDDLDHNFVSDEMLAVISGSFTGDKVRTSQHHHFRTQCIT